MLHKLGINIAVVLYKVSMQGLRTMNINIQVFVIVFALVSTLGSAVAQVCVEIDEKRDSLSVSERKGAIALMENGFRKAGETVVDAPCERPFQLSNARLGQTITATISGPNGARTFQVQRIEDLGAALEQMAHSMVTGSQLGVNSGNSISRHNVMRQQMFPNRVENDALGYLSLGPAFIVGSNPDEVPISFTGGLRLELDGVAIDISGQFIADTGDDGGQGTSILGQIGAAHFFDPVANNSGFVGGSLGLGGIAAVKGGQTFTGGGLHARVSGGYEFFRASMMRLIVQADVTLPLYDVESQNTDPSINTLDPMYTPIFGFSVGAGFAQPRKEIRVRHL